MNEQSKLTIEAAIQKVAVGPDRGRDIDRLHARALMSEILAGQTDEVQTAVLLIALRMKRESLDEFLGLFDALQANTQTAVASVSQLTCLADPFDGYLRNVTMTPFIAPVLAACGHPALMHGVESVGPKHGVTAHKVYRLAGINADVTVKEAANLIGIHGWAYVDQSRYAPELAALNSLRNRIIKRSALTTLERLLMPIKAEGKTNLVLGYVHKAYPAIYAAVANAAGYDNTVLLKGVEGGLAPALNKPLRQFWFDRDLPKDPQAHKQVVDIGTVGNADSAALAADVVGKQAVHRCLEVGLGVLNGRTDGDFAIARQSLCLAAGHILYAHSHEPDSAVASAFTPSTSLSEAVVKVQNSLDNGSSGEHFNALIQ